VISKDCGAFGFDELRVALTATGAAPARRATIVGLGVVATAGLDTMFGRPAMEKFWKSGLRALPRVLASS